MRFSVIYLASLLLLPSLVASKQRDLTASSSPQSPPSHPIPAHGDVVRFQGDRGPHLGVVVGAQQHQGGNVNIAPFVSNRLRHSSEPIEVHINELVNTHPGNVARTPRPAQEQLASNLRWWHQVRPPTVDSAGAVRGSPNYQAYQAAQSRGGHGTRR
ncbi:hypothetical protein M378DRAFT_166245 [Amanita muscaria Koide BX008]|uniref:Uncharacterized protein n=1 Tax=Amanita muscaria (strain Koide BX008) TaxID=946122 RepID=A0A0C2X084_AMAMK|nr:hypothetical protein M378DRAFT_166245 [Amanita muscaria Koide BX008]